VNNLLKVAAVKEKDRGLNPYVQLLRLLSCPYLNAGMLNSRIG